MISLTVNGKRRETEASIGLLRFLEMNQIEPKFIAIAHNGVVLRREEYDSVTLHGGDTLEIVHMVGGG